MKTDMENLLKLHNLLGRQEMRQVMVDFIKENKSSAGEEGKRVFDSMLQLLLETIRDEEKSQASLSA